MIGKSNNTTQNALLQLATEDHGRFYGWCKLATTTTATTANAFHANTITATTIAMASSCASDFLELATAIDMATYIVATLTFFGALADEHGHGEGAHGDITYDALKHVAHTSHEVPIDVARLARDHVSLQSR